MKIRMVKKVANAVKYFIYNFIIFHFNYYLININYINYFLNNF